MAATGFDWVIFFIALIALILVVIIYIIYFVQRDELQNLGLAYNIILGTASGSTETISVNGDTAYIGQSNTDLSLTINIQSKGGGTVFVTNRSSKIITMIPSGSTAGGGRFDGVVHSGTTAILAIGNGNFVRTL